MSLSILVMSLLIAGGAPAFDPAAVQEIPLDRPGIAVTKDTRIEPGTFRVTGAGEEGVVIIARDGVTLDFGGAELIGCEEGAAPDSFAGIAVVARGHKNVTIKNARIRGFKCAILAEDGDGITVEGCDLSGNYAQRLKSTPEREDGSDWLWPHENDEDQWRKNYGGGIYLKNCKKAVVRANRGCGSQNGILLSRVNDSDIYDNDFSFNSGWGLAMWRSCKNRVTHNKFDWCVRGYSHGVYWRGQDSTGILFFEQCSDNFFGWNSATHGGDGFFLYAGNETLRRTGVGGCNNNVLYRNDFSHAVANGIEATFSDNNWFIENICNDCQHGFWLGYSYNNWVAGNEVEDCAGAGIAWEHANRNMIEQNVFGGNPVAVDLWYDYDKDLQESVYGEKQNTECEKNKVVHNIFRGDRIGVRLREAKETLVEGNVFVGCETPVAVDEKSAGTRQRGNQELAAEAEADAAALLGKRSRPYAPPKTLGSLDAFLPEGTLRGRQYILVGEWGPYDFKKPLVWPAEATGGQEAKFFVYGAGAGAGGAEGGFTIEECTAAGGRGAVHAVPAEGPIPGSFVVKAESPGFHEFTVALRAGGEKLEARGTLLYLPWKVAFFHWDPAEDPREDQAAWDRLLESEPVEVREVDHLDFQWGGGAPSDTVHADRFGTLATASVDLPAGTYELRTVSDDGVRLWVNDQLVIDNWTWHGPTENTGTCTLAAGRHDIRIEHFEIDGWSVLSFSLRPVE